jgi:ABC-2 type transport system permease protein
LEILLGKALPGLIIGSLEASVILLAGIFVFNIPFTGSIVCFYISMMIFITSIVGIGLLLSSIAKTQQQALLLMLLHFSIDHFIWICNPYSKYALPFAEAYGCRPLKYCLIISRGAFLKNMSGSEIIKGSLPMLWISIVTLTLSAFFFRKKIN